MSSQGIKFLGGAAACHWYFIPTIKEVAAYYERYINVTQNIVIYFLPYSCIPFPQNITVQCNSLLKHTLSCRLPTNAFNLNKSCRIIYEKISVASTDIKSTN
jgi:hypothetical protein